MKGVGQIAGLATELGVTMGLTSAGLIFVGMWTGRHLDAVLTTRPFFTLTLLVLGVIAGQVAMVRLALRARRYLMKLDDYTFTARDALLSLEMAAKALGLAAVPVAASIVGLWLDRLVGTGVLFSLALVIIGLIVGVVGLMQLGESARMGARSR